MDRLSHVVIESVTDAYALRLFGQSAEVVGDAVRGLDFLSRAETKLREQGQLGVLSHVLTIAMAEHVELGNLDLVESTAAEARGLAHETGQSLWVTGGMVLQALTAALRGDNERAQALAGEVEQMATSRRLNPLLTMVQIARGCGWLAAGRYPEAFDALVRIFNPADPSYHAVERARGVMFLAEAAVRADRVAPARTIIVDLEHAALITPSPTLHVQLSYARAVLADDDQAESLYLAALSQDLVRWPWARAAHRARVRRLAATSTPRRRVPVAAPGGACHLQRHRCDDVGRTGAHRAPRRRRTHGRADTIAARTAVTARDADRATRRRRPLKPGDRERLFLSHRTVGSHLYHIFPKLGITSRGQLSALLESV